MFTNHFLATIKNLTKCLSPLKRWYVTGQAIANFPKKIKAPPNFQLCKYAKKTGKVDPDAMAPTPKPVKITDWANPVPLWVMDNMEVI